MSNNRGQSLIEVVIALALISMVLITLVAMAALSIKTSVFSRNQTESARFTEQASEWLRAEKDVGWTNFSTYAATPTWCFDTGTNWNTPGACPTGDTISGTIFQRSAVFAINPLDGSIQVTVTTTWTDAQGTHSSPTTIIFTNWR